MGENRNEGLRPTLSTTEKYVHDNIEIQYVSNNESCIKYSIDNTESPPSRNRSILKSTSRDGGSRAVNETSISFEDSVYHTLSTMCSSDYGHAQPLPKSALKKTYRESPPIGPSRSVSFNSVQFREHNITLGDHPSSANGPPIQLDWEAKNESTMDLERYEEDRKPRRKRRQLKMSFREREEHLTASGFTIDQLKNAWMEALKIRQQRYETVMTGSISSKMEEAWESACRKFNRIFVLSNEEQGIEVKQRTDGRSLWSYVSSDDGTPASSWFSLECMADTTTTSKSKPWSEVYLPRIPQL